ncbi:MAG: hypothetical protein ABFS05_09890 [Bacteroidota bacterium]
MCAQEVTIFGPKQYIRGSGASDYLSDTFSAQPGQARLIVKNGYNNGEKRVTDGVSTASVSLNGIEIFGPNNFNQTIYLLEENVSLVTNNTISVEMASNPGSLLTIEILGNTTQPVISFDAAPGDIAIGESSVLTWTSINAETCTIEPDIGIVDLNGSVTVTPSETTVYTLTATGSDASATAQAVVTVVPPPTVSFSADPAAISSGGVSTLTWTATDADTVTIDQGVGTVPVNGSIDVYPLVTTTYTITATGTGGSTASQTTVTVAPAPEITFAVSPQSIAAGESATLTWNSSNADTVSIDNGIGSVPLSGSLSVSPALTTTYTITASGSGGTITAQAAVTVIPLPTISFNADPQNISAGESSTLTWSVSNADTITIDKGIGEVSASGSETVRPAAATTYTLTAQGLAGTVQQSITITVSPLSLNILTPADNAIINRYDIMVQGTVNSSAGLETGININGIFAVIEGNQFTANHVPLEPGENTITATATDSEGNTITKTCIVTVQDVGDYITVSSFPESGVSPFETTIRVRATFGFAYSDISYTGPGSVEYISSTQDEYNIRITTPGIYYFTADATDDQAVVHTDTITVEVLDPTALDALLQSKWSGMKTAIASGDIEHALTYFIERARDKYRTLMQDVTDLSAFANDMEAIEMIYFESGIAKYRIHRTEDVNGVPTQITYYIYLTRDTDGIYKIYKF